MRPSSVPTTTEQLEEEGSEEGAKCAPDWGSPTVCGCFSLILKGPEGTDSVCSPTVWAPFPRLPFCTEDRQPIVPVWLPWSPAPSPWLLQILFQKLYPG